MKSQILLLSACASLSTGIAHADITRTFIPLTDARDVLVDDRRNLAYVATSTGMIQRLNLSSLSLLPPWTLGVNFQAMDITPDGASLYVTERSSAAQQAMIRKVNLNT